MTTVGRIQHIARYPVKSMRGELLDEAQVELYGLPGDRAYTFVQEGVHNLFPYLTGRECPDLMRYQPEWDFGDQPRTPRSRPSLVVRTPEGARLPIGSDELRADIERRSNRSIRLHSDYRGNQDVAYMSVVAMPTLRALAEASGVPADHRRWRMTPVLEADIEPFGEKEWVGRTLTVGGVRLVVTEQDRRCVMTTLDPETGASTPAVLKNAGEMNDAFVGVYASVAVAGKVAVGDEVRLA
jgi:uncharacterized protein YcbX